MSNEAAKALTVRVPVSLYKTCAHRMVDDLVNWQQLLIKMLEDYAAGEYSPAIRDEPLEQK